MIDAELAAIVRARAKPPRLGGDSLLRLRAWYAEKGTNFVDQRRGPVHPVKVV